MKRGIVALVFRCSPLDEPSRVTEEAAEVRWMSLDEVRDSMAPAYAVRVTDAFDATLPHTRSRDGLNLLE